LTRPEITFTCPIPPSLPQWQQLVDAYSEALDPLGYDFSMVYLNGRREIYELKNTSKYDGTCIRRRSFVESFRSYGLVLVDAPVGDPETAVWRYKKAGSEARKADSSAAGLFHPKATVGYLRGNGLAAEFLEAYRDISIETFLKPNLGMKTLASGRIDYWVGYAHTADHLVEHLDIGANVERVAIVRQDFFYPFITTKYSELKEPFEKSLRRVMEKRGSLIK
jgi:hypothetical protein